MNLAHSKAPHSVTFVKELPKTADRQNSKIYLENATAGDRSAVSGPPLMIVSRVRLRTQMSNVLDAPRVVVPKADYPSARVDADLISTTGVPSNASIGPIFIRVPLISRTMTGCSPSGFGRAGERV